MKRQMEEQECFEDKQLIDKTISSVTKKMFESKQLEKQLKQKVILQEEKCFKMSSDKKQMKKQYYELANKFFGE